MMRAGKPFQCGSAAVHLVGDQRGVLDPLPHRNAFDEIGSLVVRWAIGAAEDDLDRLLLQADLVEHVLEPRALPARAAHRAVAPFDARHVRLKQAAAIARALIDGNHLGGGHRLEIVERDLRCAIGAIAADGKLPGLGVDLGNDRQVIAHEERVVRRDRGAEIFERRFVVGRPVAELDERLLSRLRVEHGAGAHAVRHCGRQVEAGGRGCRRLWQAARHRRAGGHRRRGMSVD